MNSAEYEAVNRLTTPQISGSEIYRAIVEQAPDAMIFADGKGTIRLWNAAAKGIFGYAEGEAIGESLDLIIPEHLRAAHWRGYDQAMTAGRTKLGGKALATRATHKLGGKLYVEVTFKIVNDERIGVSGALAVARDITQRYLAERARRNP